MPIRYDVDIYRLQIARMYQVGGEGYRWLDKVKRAMHRACVNEAPSRSNTLRSSHRSFIRGTNQYAAHAHVINIAGHAEFVHQGTLMVAPIYPDGDWLSLPAGNGYGPKALRKVAGQAPNPWLDRACSRIARRYGGLTIIP